MLNPSVTVDEMLKVRAELKRFIDNCLHRGVHWMYWGDFDDQKRDDNRKPKATLLKPGAELLARFFGFTSSFDVLSKFEDFEKGEYAYTVNCVLYQDGKPITNAIASANNHEKKWQFMWVFDNQITEEQKAQATGRRTGKNRYGGEYTQYQVKNTDGFISNTTLRMASKRAYVAAVLEATGVSEFFTSDMEDREAPESKSARSNLLAGLVTAMDKYMDALQKSGKTEEDGLPITKGKVASKVASEVSKGEFAKCNDLPDAMLGRAIEKIYDMIEHDFDVVESEEK